tara:strand:- start:2812 stop:2931 length:120 start_codon:yes stop_codon:yes gene_type:complete
MGLHPGGYASWPKIGMDVFKILLTVFWIFVCSLLGFRLY